MLFFIAGTKLLPGGWRLFMKMRYIIHPSSYLSSMFKELYNKLVAIEALCYKTFGQRSYKCRIGYLSLSLSLAHKHARTHTYIYIFLLCFTEYMTVQRKSSGNYCTQLHSLMHVSMNLQSIQQYCSSMEETSYRSRR